VLIWWTSLMGELVSAADLFPSFFPFPLPLPLPLPFTLLLTFGLDRHSCSDSDSDASSMIDGLPASWIAFIPSRSSSGISIPFAPDRPSKHFLPREVSIGPRYFEAMSRVPQGMTRPHGPKRERNSA